MIFKHTKQDVKNGNNIKLTPEMLNLLGCNKNNFEKLLKQMNYKTYKKNDEIYFKYSPIKNNFKKNKKSINISDSPFSKLTQLNIK